MELSDALAKATANGWSDDTRYSPSNVAGQISTVRDGVLASVSIRQDGAIKWTVCTLDGTAGSEQGDASSVDEALAAAECSLLAVAGTLF